MYFLKNEIESILKLVVECFTTKYFQFSGRSNRKENLIFFLFNSAILFANIYFIDIPLVDNIYMLITTIPILAQSVRRLHDINKSGWWMLTMIPTFIFTTFFLDLKVVESTPILILMLFIIIFLLSGVIDLWLVICTFFLLVLIVFKP
jgi:uncharacterized membrane protein YhaH (DUF805 family)